VGNPEYHSNPGIGSSTVCGKCGCAFTRERPPQSPLPDGKRFHPTILLCLEATMEERDRLAAHAKERGEVERERVRRLRDLPTLGQVVTDLAEEAIAASKSGPGRARRGDGHVCEFEEIPALGSLPCGLCVRRACVLCGCEKWECPHEREHRIRLEVVDVTEVQAVMLCPAARILRVVPMGFQAANPSEPGEMLQGAALVVLTPQEGLQVSRTIRMLQVGGADRLPNPARQRSVGMLRIEGGPRSLTMGLPEPEPVVAFLHVFEEVPESPPGGAR